MVGGRGRMDSSVAAKRKQNTNVLSLKMCLYKPTERGGEGWKAESEG